MGRPVVIIPDEMLPEVVIPEGCTKPKLPAMPNDWGSMRYADIPAEDRARRYLEEACRSLALAKFWANRSEMQKEELP